MASQSLDPVASHACGMTVDEEERRHIFVVYNKDNNNRNFYDNDVDGDGGSSSAVEIYSVSDDAWTHGPDMPGTIAGTRAIQLEDTFQVRF